jgi:hypothetical protein
MESSFLLGEILGRGFLDKRQFFSAKFGPRIFYVLASWQTLFVCSRIDGLSPCAIALCLVPCASALCSLPCALCSICT